MKAAVCEAFGKPLVIQDVPEPSVGPEEVLIRMKGCGVCHSDLHLVDGDWADWGTPLPIIPGHEVTGVVEKAGDGGTDLGAAAPLLCAGITVFSPLRRAGNLAGKTVAVAGIGGLGHLGIRMAAAMGAHVVAITRGGDKKDLAHELGAHAVIDSEKEKVRRRLRTIGGADLILLTGISARLFEGCIPGLAPNGTLGVLASFEEPVTVNPAALRARQIRITGSIVGTRDDMDAMLRFAADRGIAPIVERHPLGTVNDVLERMRRGEIRLRAVLTPWPP